MRKRKKKKVVLAGRGEGFSRLSGEEKQDAAFDLQQKDDNRVPQSHTSFYTLFLISIYSYERI